MKFETERSELALLSQMNREELGRVLVILIKNDRQVRRTIIELVLSSPYIVRQY